MDNYWALYLKDGSSVEIPPEFVMKVNEKMLAREVISLRQRTIPFSEIKEFKQIQKRKIKVLEAVAQAFLEPVYNKDGSVACKWVKMEVPSERWERYYSQLAGYKRIDGTGGAIYAAWRQPLHQITEQVIECNPYELEKLDNKPMR